jgi:hypothetical protein
MLSESLRFSILALSCIAGRRKMIDVSQSSAPPQWVSRAPPHATPRQLQGHAASRATGTASHRSRRTRSLRSALSALAQVEKQEQHLLDPPECRHAWPTSDRNDGRLQIGTGGRLQFGMQAGFIGMREASNRSRIVGLPQTQRGTYLKLNEAACCLMSAYQRWTGVRPTLGEAAFCLTRPMGAGAWGCETGKV